MTTLDSFAPVGVHTKRITEEWGILPAYAPDGSLLASAMKGRDGWHVSLNGATCLIYVEHEAEARSLLAEVVRCLSTQAAELTAEAALPLSDRPDAEL